MPIKREARFFDAEASLQESDKRSSMPSAHSRTSTMVELEINGSISEVGN